LRAAATVVSDPIEPPMIDMLGVTPVEVPCTCQQ
jgi:hypothetical protein